MRKKSFVVYVLWNVHNRLGEFEFLTHCQANWTTDFAALFDEREDILIDSQGDIDRADLKVLRLVVEVLTL